MTYITSRTLTLMATLTILSNLQASQVSFAVGSASTSSVVGGSVRSATSEVSLSAATLQAPVAAITTDPIAAISHDVFSLAMCFFDAGHKIVAFRLLEANSRVGHIKSLKFLGDMYRSGEGMQKNVKRALACYKRAVREGGADACSDAGIMYLDGDGEIAQNFTKAYRYFQLGVARGDPWSFYYLGRMYWLGEGEVEQDGKRAVEYFETLLSKLSKKTDLSADDGLTGLFRDTCYACFYLYNNGIGVSQDQKRAQEYLCKASPKGPAEQARLLNRFKEAAREGHAQSLDALKKLAQEGDSESAFFLGSLYETGQGVPKDLEQAFLFYVSAAKKEKQNIEATPKALQMVWSGVLKKSLVAKIGENKAAKRLGELVDAFIKQVQPIADGTRCPICYKLFNYQNSMIFTKPCLHIFCYDCLEQWQNGGHDRCPTCQSTLS